MPTPTRRNSLHTLTLCALFAALTCVLSPIAIPIGPIPVSLGLCGVLITALTLPPLQALTAVGVFLGIGLCGIPVFSGGGSGATVLVGPTGGYLWSFLLVAPIVSLLARAIAPTSLRAMRSMPACLCGVLICYLCGTLQYCVVTNTPPLSALLVCVLPFLPFDLLKALAATYLGAHLAPLIDRKQRHG